MNVVFFGTPEFAEEFLASLHEDEDILVSAVVCQPDKPVGRKKVLTSPATKDYAKANRIPVFQPESLKKDPEIVARLTQMEPDVFVIVAYGKILPESILNIPRLGNINVHPSLLPKYRGPSPIQAAIAAGDSETGISIMLIDEEMDHGPILAQETLHLSAEETPESLREKVVELGAPLLVETVKGYAAGDIQPQEQDHEAATFCKLLKKEDGRIDWTRTAEEIDAQMRAYTPWPGTWTTWNDKMLKIHAATVSSESSIEPGQVEIKDNKLLIGTGSTPLEVTNLQLEGKQRTTAETFIRGYADKINNARLG